MKESHAHPEQVVCVGQFLRPHGVRGSIKVKSFTRCPRDIFSFSGVMCGTLPVSLSLQTSVPGQDDTFIVGVSQVVSRSGAEGFRGKSLFLPVKDLPPLEKGVTIGSEDEFYQHELINLTVSSADGCLRGVVSGIHNFGAGDILEVSWQGETYFLPFTREAIPRVDWDKHLLYADAAFLDAFAPPVETPEGSSFPHSKVL